MRVSSLSERAVCGALLRAEEEEDAACGEEEVGEQCVDQLHVRVSRVACAVVVRSSGRAGARRSDGIESRADRALRIASGAVRG